MKRIWGWLIVVLLPVACCTAQCTSNQDCPAGYYCQKAVGDCNGVGQIVIRPSACPAIWDPVCGCDGRTYANACEAAAAGVNIMARGQCQAATCLSNAECPDGYYCFKVQGDCQGVGTPAKRPTTCPQVWEPVCGCDGQTYSNACTAALFGANVAYQGPCQVVPSASVGIQQKIQETQDADVKDTSMDPWMLDALPSGAKVMMMDPNVAADDVHTGASGLDHVRILWSEPLVFDENDIYIEDEVSAYVPFTVSGSGSSLMTIDFGHQLQRDRYVIYIEDSVYDLNDIPIDGDGDGIAGGEAKIVMEHRMRADFNHNNRIDADDLAAVADLWLAETSDPNQ